MYNETYADAAIATASNVITFKNAAGNSRTVTLTVGMTGQQQADAINAQTKDIGITALSSQAGAKLSFQSNNSFSFTSDWAGGGGGIGRVVRRFRTMMRH